MKTSVKLIAAVFVLGLASCAKQENKNEFKEEIQKLEQQDAKIENEIESIERTENELEDLLKEIEE